MAKPFAVSDAEFNEKVIEAELPVLVDFWAEWCMPCKMISPIVDELAEEMDGVMDFAKVDVDSSPITAVTYGIPQHSGAAHLQGRQARGADSGRGAQGPAEEEDTGGAGRLTLQPRRRFRRRRERLKLRPLRLCMGHLGELNGSGWGPVALADFKSRCIPSQPGWEGSTPSHSRHSFVFR